MPIAGKTGVIEHNPNSRTVQFAGKSISLSAIAREHGMDLSNLSLIMSGKRIPNLKTALKLSRILGLSLDKFQYAIEERKLYLVVQQSRQFEPLESPIAP